MSILMRRAFFGFPHFILLWRCFTISTKENLINEEIKIPEVRVVTNEGEMLGVLKIAKALEMAQDKDLDLVLISPAAVPPVCKIMDYGKFCFEKEKRAKEAKKKQQVVDVKEIQLSCTIGEHDFQTKLNHAHRFLKGGDKVKVVVRFRGREMRHTELGADILAKFEKGCEGVGTAEKKAVLDGRNMTMFISPVKQ
jgi:translation initiation factor IF-3